MSTAREGWEIRSAYTFSFGISDLPYPLLALPLHRAPPPSELVVTAAFTVDR